MTNRRGNSLQKDLTCDPLRKPAYYDPLYDKHLILFFAKPVVRKTLKANRIVPPHHSLTPT